ncbi:MAG: class I SAM-dependent methyltransferase [Streptosporangiaceae bacterium]
MDDLPGAESQEERDDRLRHGSSFGAAAAAYAEHRPGYAEAAVRWALEPVSARRPLRVLDLAAGTGKLTETLVRLGADVTAVEPDPGMLAELRRRLGSVRSMPGRAEKIPLPDGAVDAVLAGQAMHWFDLDRALPELARVLAPGGLMAGLWNVDDDRVSWVAGLADISKRQASVTLASWRDGGGQSRQERLLTAGSAWFETAETGEFGHGQSRTADSLLATMATHSHLLVMEPAERDSLLGGVGEFLRSRPETASGEFLLPMVTVVVRARRR